MSTDPAPAGDVFEPRSDNPVVHPGLSIAAMTDRVCAIALRERAFLWWWIAFVPCLALTGVLGISIAYLFYAGIGIWGVNRPVMWGFAILSYAWWIAIASGGAIISALFSWWAPIGATRSTGWPNR